MMHNGFQPMPSIQELHQQLQSLQQQLVLATGNPQAQHQIQEQMNNVKAMLIRSQQQYNNNANQQYTVNQPRQYGQQQQQYGQHQPVNMQMQYGTPMMNNGQNYVDPRAYNGHNITPNNSYNGVGRSPFNSYSTNSRPEVATSRYDTGRRTSNTTETYGVDNTDNYNGGNSSTVENKLTVELKPLEGSEFQLLLDNGIKVEKEILGDYYRYKIKGTDMKNANEETDINLSPISKVVKLTPEDIKIGNSDYANCLKIATKLGVAALENDTINTVINFTRELDIIASKSVPNTYYIDLIKNSKSLIDIAKKLRSVERKLTDDNSNSGMIAHIFKINSLLTQRVVEAVKMIANIQIYIEDFMDDIELLVNEYIPQNLDTEDQTRYNNILDTVMKNLKIDVENKEDLCTSTLELEKFYSVKYFEDTSLIYSTSAIFKIKIFDIVGKDNPLAVTSDSFPLLYKMFDAVFKDPKNTCSRTNKAMLVFDVHESVPTEFIVYLNVNGDYSICRNN